MAIDRSTIDRATTNDLVMLAIDAHGEVAQCLGAVLVLSTGPGFDVDSLSRLIAERAVAVPRLGQRLQRVPPGCGRPVWLDDPLFDARRHITRRRCTGGDDEAALLRVAAAVMLEPLPDRRPLWTVVLVTGLSDGKVALIVVLHHMLADGLGGLAILDSLLDGVHSASIRRASERLPSVGLLALDAFRCRVRAVSRIPATLRTFPAALRSAGGLHPPKVPDCSLLRPTGPYRRLAVARTDLEGIRAIAHLNDGTVNDVILAAVTGALRTLLTSRGETLDELTVTIPVDTRAGPAGTGQLGNDNTPLVVTLPSHGGLPKRIRQISRTVRRARTSSTGPSLAAMFGPLFRVLAAVGAYRYYLRHQRRFHTIVSNLRGPSEVRTIAGSTVESIIPISVGELGNVAVTFVGLTYAGTLTITAIVDPAAFPDLPLLLSALQEELGADPAVR